MLKLPYCTQNDGNCDTCSLVNYGRDCANNPILKVINVAIPRDLWRLLSVRAAAEGKDKKEVLAEALEAYLAPQEQKGGNENEETNTSRNYRK